MAMTKKIRWMMATVLVCGLVIFSSCVNDDNPVVEPVTELLQDGEWTGSGEGRSGCIIAKVVVKNHQVAVGTRCRPVRCGTDGRQ